MPEEEGKIEAESPGLPKEAKKSIETQELSPKEILHLAKTSIEAINAKNETELDQENWKEIAEQAILDGVKNLPEALADQLKTVDTDLLNKRAEELIVEISKEKDPAKIAQLQTELIFQYIGIISRVQNGGDKGFTPEVAKEVQGMDCSLSVWALKEKLESSGVKNISFEFGNPPGHMVGIVGVADGRKLYVDAQNGIVEEVELENVADENNPEAKSIFEIKSKKRIIGHLPNEGETTRTKRDGSDYVARYIGVDESGLALTLGNMHMYVNPESPTFNTETARKFRESQNIPNEVSELVDGKWQNYYRKFEKFVKSIQGETIYDTKFAELEDRNHTEYEEARQKAEDQKKIKELGDSIN